MKTLLRLVLFAVLSLLPGVPARAWDYENHRLVNELALAGLPKNFPAFVREPAARERVAFLSGEPDRWRNTTEMALKHLNEPDHFFDVEDLALYQIAPRDLAPFRYDFVAQMGAMRAANPTNFPVVDVSVDPGHNRNLPGFLPWAIAENFGKLKSAFSYLKVFEELGTPEEIANARANILYIMGVMGHYVGDATQPLHTTRHYNGWVGENPKGYTTSKRFHSWIDGGYLAKAGIDRAALLKKAPASKPLWPAGTSAKEQEVFPKLIEFLMEQHALMEPLYQMDKDGKLTPDGEKGLEGRVFLEKQIIKGGRLLGDLWVTAWQHAPPDNFLKAQLNKRKLGK
jgi:hypothetical protein